VCERTPQAIAEGRSCLLATDALQPSTFTHTVNSETYFTVYV